MPGAKSRWSGAKDVSWQPLRPELVVEVAYEHMQGDRFRHTAQFRRWRGDKKPHDCTYAQLDVVAPHELARIFAVGRGPRQRIGVVDVGVHAVAIGVVDHAWAPALSSSLPVRER